MQLFLGAVPIILRLFSKARGHLLFSIIIPGIICQSLTLIQYLHVPYSRDFLMQQLE